MAPSDFYERPTVFDAPFQDRWEDAQIHTATSNDGESRSRRFGKKATQLCWHEICQLYLDKLG